MDNLIIPKQILINNEYLIVVFRHIFHHFGQLLGVDVDECLYYYQELFFVFFFRNFRVVHCQLLALKFPDEVPYSGDFLANHHCNHETVTNAII